MDGNSVNPCNKHQRAYCKKEVSDLITSNGIIEQFEVSVRTRYKRGAFASEGGIVELDKMPFIRSAMLRHLPLKALAHTAEFGTAAKEMLDQERERRKAVLRVTPLLLVVEPTLPVENVHPSIAVTAKALRKARADSDEVVRARGPAAASSKLAS
ncbi:hypothetical protein [Bradyrhizobium sp. SZCCHNR1039]|uniref:hypothetical protein n=1 Tax=Bradyrhizobium sp. SZCCHNR1039 TaxID=3057350 RepID=UPI00291709F0|nr:hypothetical protein [Bradyrhizobium sp. SZCCHNR1039]